MQNFQALQYISLDLSGSSREYVLKAVKTIPGRRVGWCQECFALLIQVFNAMTPEKRARISDEMQDIQLIDMAGGSVEYDIRTDRDGRQCSFLLRFEMDGDGLWRIDFF